MSSTQETFRRLLPCDLVVDGWESVESYYRELLARPLPDAMALERWLEDWSELDAAIEDRHTQLYVAMTLDTLDEAVANRYRAFENAVLPNLKAISRDLATRYLDAPPRRALDATRFAVLDRSLESEVRLFREENIPLELEDSELSQRYQQISGAWSVTFRGEERTPQQMGVFLEDQDRSTREEAFEALVARRLQDEDALDELYDRMIAVRTQVGRQAGFETYQEYAFERLGRFDYAPEDCERWCDAIEAFVVPRVRDLHELRRKRMGLDLLEPFDLGFDPYGNEPLRPFADGRALVDAVTRVFDAVDPELGSQFAGIDLRAHLDLESRKGKAPGGYQATFQESRLPFIFTNAVGLHRDVQTLLHEGGHSFHTLACRNLPLLRDRNPPIEFAEVASMGMELLAERHLDLVYRDERDVLRARLQNWTGILTLLPWIACIDTFQRWVYTHPDHAQEERQAQWLAVHERFRGGDSWRRFEDAQASLWHKQNHVFTAPFYYIEYALAQVGALQLCFQARHDAQATLRRYRDALALGGSRPLPELFGACGLSFGLEPSVLEPLVEETYAEIRTIEARLPELG